MTDVTKNWRLGIVALKVLTATIIVMAAFICIGLHVRMYTEIFGGYSALRNDLIHDMTRITEETTTRLVNEKLYTILQHIAKKKIHPDDIIGGEKQ